MIGFSRTRSLAVCAGILALSAGWTLGARPTLSAQSPATDGALDPALVSAFKWRSVGPDRGGRSIAVSGVKGRPREAYFGAAGGGLWKTTDGGAKWAPITDGLITSSSVGAVAVSESSPDIVYIGMGEACIRGNIMGGDGVYKSTDAGKTWTNVGFHDSDAISKIRIHPDQSRHRVRRRLRPLRQGQRRARRLQEHRRRQELEEGAVPQRQDRRHRRRDRSQEPERDVRRAVGGVPRRVPDVERRPGQRTCSSRPTAARPGRKSRATRDCPRA